MGIRSSKDGGPTVFYECDGAFGVFAYGDAGGSKYAAFFLESAAVGEHNACAHIEAEHFMVADGIDED